MGRLSQTVLEQLAQSLAVWRIELLDQHGDTLGEWIPTAGPMTAIQDAVFYRVYQLRTRCEADPLAVNTVQLAWLLAPQVLPPAGLDLVVRLGPYHADQTPSARNHKPARQKTAAGKTINKHQNTSTLAVALQTALRDYLNNLIQRDALNHLNGSGWAYEKALYLIGKEAAEALRQHPALADWKIQFHKNTVLYRALLAQGITERCGDKPVWNITVRQESATRKVAAIKMPLTDRWLTLLEPVAPFRGTLDVPNTHTAATRSAAPSKPPAVSRHKKRTESPDYATLFNERPS